MIFNEYIIKERIQETHDIVVLKLVPQNVEQVFDFKPGQYIMAGIYDDDGEISESRALSLASSALNKEYIELGFKIYGTFTKRAKTLKEGDKMGISLPTGFFTFSDKRMQEVVMFAGGIGITPFMGMIRYIFDKKLSNKITLIYSNKAEKDIAYKNELLDLEKVNPNFKVIFTITDKVSESWNKEVGRVDKDMIKKYVINFSDTHFLLCGPTGFMDSTIKILKEFGVDDEYIEIERF